MKPVRTWTRLITLACLGGLLPSIALAQTIVWTDGDSGKIQRKNTTGGDVGTILQFASPQIAEQIHYDPIGKKLYYLFFPGGSTVLFQRANVDGSNPENLPITTWGTFGVNVESRKLHWWNNSGHLYRAELDGTDIESHFFNNCCMFGLEPHGNTLYFGAGSGMQKGIWRADADGSNAQFLHVTPEPSDLAFDPVENKLYMGALNNIVRINTDGSNYQVVLTLSTSDIRHLEVDYHGRKLYWIEDGIRAIRRCNLDGTNIEDFVTSVTVGNPKFDPRGLTIVDSRSIPALSRSGIATACIVFLLAGIAAIKRQVAE